jgi:hypothetical protein
MASSSGGGNTVIRYIRIPPPRVFIAGREFSPAWTRVALTPDQLESVQSCGSMLEVSETPPASLSGTIPASGEEVDALAGNHVLAPGALYFDAEAGVLRIAVSSDGYVAFSSAPTPPPED